MTTCPIIAEESNSDISLSTYERTVGTYVVIGCKGFGRHVSDPTNVICQANGAWSAEPKLECSTALDEREQVILGAALLCVALIIITSCCLCCYCCCFRRRRGKYFGYGAGNTWRERFFGYRGRDNGRDRYSDDGNYFSSAAGRRYYGDNGLRESRREMNIYNIHRDKPIRRDYDGAERDMNIYNIHRDKPIRREYDGAELRKSRRDSLSDRSFNFRKSRRNSFTEGSELHKRPDIRRTRRYSYSEDRPIYRDPPMEPRRTRRFSDPYMYGPVSNNHYTNRYDAYGRIPHYYGPEFRRRTEYEPEMRRRYEYEPEVRRRYEYEPEVRRRYEYQPPVVIRRSQRPRIEEFTRFVDVNPEYKLRQHKVVEYIDRPMTVAVDGGLDNYGYLKSETKARLKPKLLNESTVYVKYEQTGNSNYVRAAPVSKARITELGDDAGTDIVPYSGFGKSQRYANGSVDQTLNYFTGRQDFPYENRRRSPDQKELDHVLYHGKGKMTEIYDEVEDAGELGRSKLLRASHIY